MQKIQNINIKINNMNHINKKNETISDLIILIRKIFDNVYFILF